MKFSWTGILCILLLSFFIGCAEGANVDAPTEFSCATATGLWTVSSVTCNGAVNETENLVYYLISDGRISQTQGTTACASTFSWDFVVGDDEPTLDMTGSGTLSCSSNGASVDTCTSPSNTCFNTVDITNFRNNYPTCVISRGVLTFSRNVSAVNNPDGFSVCNNGETEVVSLVQATDIDLDPIIEIDPSIQVAVLSIAGPNPADFGTLSIDSSRSLTFTVTSSGNVAAVNIGGSGLDAPYSFLGGSYPGTGGTCGANLEVGATCTIVVNFTPRVANTFADTIQLTYAAPSGATQTLNHGVLGIGSNNLGILQISDGPFYSYGDVSVGNVGTHIFTVTNTGGGVASSMVAIPLSAPFNFSGGAYPGAGGTCGLSLAAGATCDLEIEFSPGSIAPFNGLIQIDYSDGFLPQSTTRSIFGNGN